MTSLTNASLYNFRVSAINLDGTATASNTASATPMVLFLQDDFDSRSNGSIDGQNGWAINTGTTWTVGAGGSGKIVVSGTATYPTNYVAQGDQSWVNQRVKVDFLAGTTKPIIWLRKQDKSGTGDGYILRRESSTWYIEKYISQGSGLVTLASASTPVTLTSGSWYTIDVSVIDNSDGNPVLTAYVYAQGGSRPATSFLTYTDTGENFTEGYVAIGANGFVTSFDNASIYGTTEEGVRLISPAHRVSAVPTVATQAIIFENDKVSYIPYIQTSTTLTAKASVGSTVLPVGGGIKFTLNEGLATEQSSVDMIAPFSAAFTSLAKGTYTLDVDVVDSSQVVQVGDDYHDEVTGVGIGDIYTIIGDSITAGFYETDYGTTHFKTWLDAPEGSTSNDNRNYPQYHSASGLQGYHLGYAKYLNNSLSSYLGYPIFFMNESLSGYAVATWQTKLDHFSLGVKIKNRLKKLQPNGLIIPLGGNDALDVDAATFGTRYQTLIDTLNTTYTTIEDSKTYLSIPVHSIPEPRASTLPTYVPIIEALITTNNTKAGPDFLNFFYYNQDNYYFDLYHPNDAGFVQMGRLWNIVTIAPKNVAVSQSGTSAILTWDDLTSYESSIAGYTVEYGTSPGVYTTTVDVGNVRTATITGLSSEQTYYFAVSGYDDNANPAITATETQRSEEVSLAYDETAATISAVSATASSTGATITWTTNLDASSRVAYGLTDSYGTTTAETDTTPRVSSHSVILSGLASCTTYHYRVYSKIATTVETTGTDNTFTTEGCSGTSGSYTTGCFPPDPSVPGTEGPCLGINNPPVGPILINPTPTTTNFNYTRNLKLKTKGSDVKTLQQALNKILKLTEPLIADGIFGNHTLKALKMFQKERGLVQDGVFGPKSMKEINSNL